MVKSKQSVSNAPNALDPNSIIIASRVYYLTLVGGPSGTWYFTIPYHSCNYVSFNLALIVDPFYLIRDEEALVQVPSQPSQPPREPGSPGYTVQYYLP